MKDKIILAIKGFVFGIANIIPGVSGGTIALTMGIYEELISSISHFFEKPKKSIIFLLPFAIGAALSILLMSKLISFSLDKFPFPTTIFFTGLIIGGIPLLTKKIQRKKAKPLNVLLFLITFSTVICMAFMKEGTNVVSIANPAISKMLILTLVGMITAATMVIPGVSGSFVLMLLGFYEPIVNTIGNITDFSLLTNNLMILVPFGIGILLGIILISKLIEYLFAKHETPTYYAILGFIIASVITLAMNAFSADKTNLQIIFGIILFIIGSIIGYKLGDE